MAVVVLTVYERDDPPVAGGSATSLGTIDRLVTFEATAILSTHGFNAIDIRVNRHDDPSNLIQAGRWVTVAFPAIQTDPVMTVRLVPSHTTVLSQSGESNEIIHVGGLGILSLLEHARLLEVPSAPSPPASAERGSSNVPGRWQWRTQPPGAIITRGFEEGQNHVGTPLAPITISFDRDEDSDGNAWVSLAEDRFFEINTNADIWNLYQRLAQAGDLFLVEHYDFGVDAYNAFGTTSFGIDRTSATFASGKVRVHADPDVFSNILTDLEEEGEDEPYTHVSVEGANATFVTVADPGYTSGPGRMAAIEYRDSDDPDMLERVGLEFLRRQHARTVVREVEITPGDDEANGRYLPWKHLVPGDLHTLDAAGIDEDVRLIALRVELVPGAHDATTEDAHRSLRVVCEYNDASSEPGGDGGGMGGEGAPGSGSEMCCGPRPPASSAEGNTARFYHSGHDAGSGSTAESTAAPTLTVSDIDAAWEHNNSGAFDYMMLYRTPANSVGALASWDAVNASAGDVTVRGYLIELSEAERAIVASGGTVKGQNRARSRYGTGIGEGAQNHLIETCGRIYRPGSGFVATLWDVGDLTGDLKFPAQATDINRSFAGSFDAYASVADGDYLVVDYGAKHIGPTTGGTGIAIRFYDQGSTSDLPEDQSSTASANSWIELSGSGSAGDAPIVTVRQGQGEYGDPGVYVPTGSTVEAGLLSDDGEHYFNDSDIEVPIPTELGLPSTATNVRAALSALAQTAEATPEIVAHGAMGSAETFDLADGPDHSGTVDADTTITLTGATNGKRAFITGRLTNDGVHTPSFAGGTIVDAGFVSGYNSTDGAENFFTAISDDGGTVWFLFPAGGGDTAAGGGGIGPLLITSEPAGSPLVFADLLQNSEGTDLLYASEP